MTVQDRNYKTAFLAIFKKSGEFEKFRWYDLDLTLEQTQERCLEWNKENESVGITAEIVTDPLIRDICAHAERLYKEARRKAMNELENARKRVDKAIEGLESAVDDLNHIREEME